MLLVPRQLRNSVPLTSTREMREGASTWLSVLAKGPKTSYRARFRALILPTGIPLTPQPLSRVGAMGRRTLEGSPHQARNS